MPLGLGEGSFFGADKTIGGSLTVLGGVSGGQPALRFRGMGNTGFTPVNSTTLDFGTASTAWIRVTSGGLNIVTRLGLGSNASSPDTGIERDASAILNQRSGGTPQTFRVSRVVTDLSNYEWLSFAAADPMVITPQAAGTGTLRGLVIGATGTSLAFFGGTPATKPTAYTQTYATADKTHADFTSADIGAFTGGVTGFVDAAERDNIRTQFNALRADVADLKQLANSVIDDLQALSLVG